MYLQDLLSDYATNGDSCEMNTSSFDNEELTCDASRLWHSAHILCASNEVHAFNLVAAPQSPKPSPPSQTCNITTPFTH
jgi:hypothetical protein